MGYKGYVRYIGYNYPIPPLEACGARGNTSRCIIEHMSYSLNSLDGDI